MEHAFVSYCREDGAEVDRLVAALTSFGVTCWLDRMNLKPGQRWRKAIRDAIREGAWFIACFSQNYARKGRSYMNEELTLAIEELRLRPYDRTWFIPVMLSECDLPEYSIGAGESLNDIQFVSLHSDWEAGLHSILAVVQPAPPEIRSLEWSLSAVDAGVRASAATALGAIDARWSLSLLLRALDDSDVRVSLCVVRSLRRLGHPSSFPLLVARLQKANAEYEKHLDWHTEWHLAQELVEAIGENPSPAGLSVLIEMLCATSGERERCDYLRHFATEALKQIGAPAIAPLFDAVIEDRSCPKLRAVLVELRAPGAAQAFVKMLGREDVCHVAEEALRVLNDASVIPDLMALLLTRPNLVVRKSVVNVLRAFGAPDDALRGMAGE